MSITDVMELAKAYNSDLAEKEAALNAEKQKVRELVEALDMVNYEILRNDIQIARALIEKYKEEPNNE